MQKTEFIFMMVMVLLFMIFNHIVDDFNQGEFLSTYKQRIMWKKDKIGKKKMYRDDYKVCLIVHSLKWSIIIHIPIFIITAIVFLTGSARFGFHCYCIELLIHYAFTILLDTEIHYYIDDLKANQYEINLIQDQLGHLAQIIGTWVFYIFVFRHMIRFIAFTKGVII